MHIRLRHNRTDVGLDENRAIVWEIRDQRPGVIAQGMQSLSRNIQPEVGAGQDGTDAHENRDDREGPDGMMGPHRVAVRPGRPMPATQHEHVQVEENAATPPKYTSAVRLTIPLAKSWKCVSTASARADRSRS